MARTHPADLAAPPAADVGGGCAAGHADLVPATAGIVLPPVYPADDSSGLFPDGICPLPGITTSGGPGRPGRLLYPDATVLTCRPAGEDTAWKGLAAGVVRAGGDLAPGWLQVVRDGDGRLRPVHPALISPWPVDPYTWLSYRERKRWREFDAAEAAGLGFATLAARLVDRGDQIRPTGTAQAEIREVIRAQAAGGTEILVVSADATGDVAFKAHWALDQIEVLIPDQHPAEYGPDRLQMFAQAGTGRKRRPAAPRPPAAGHLTTDPWFRSWLPL